MSWTNPKTNWSSGDKVENTDFNRIENNIKYVNDLVEPGKSLVRQSILDNGGTVSGNPPTFAQLATGIGTIAPGAGDTNALASDILVGKTAIVNNRFITGTMANRGSQYGSVTSQGGTYYIPKGYHDGNGYVTANFPVQSSANRTLSYQGHSYTIPAGYHNGTARITASFPTQSTSNRILSSHLQSTTISSGYYPSNFTVMANISGLVASNIKKGATVGGVRGNYEQIRYHSGRVTLSLPSGSTAGLRGSVTLAFKPLVVIANNTKMSGVDAIRMDYSGGTKYIKDGSNSLSNVYISGNTIYFEESGRYTEYADYKVIGIDNI